MTGFSRNPRATHVSGRVTNEAPPQAPTTTRRFALTKKQIVGLPLIASVPLLCLLGFFGERSERTTMVSTLLEVAIKYPSRFRYRQFEGLEISVRNRGTRVVDTVHVWLDTAYITRFSSVRIVPTPSRAFTVDLLQVRPGESRLVDAELWGERYGLHRGRIIVTGNDDTARVAISTFVFP
jgi:hypothetical protein